MKRKKSQQVLRPDGELRQSQIIHTFGPGAMVDLVDRSVVIGGLEHWRYGEEGFVSLDDARLRRAVLPRLKALDPELDLGESDYFRMPPAGERSEAQPWIGIRALEFPRWFVCTGCRRLARALDAFEEKRGRYHHECQKGQPTRVAVPVRFVAGCPAGHLMDFPWIAFAHPEGHECPRPELYLDELSSGDISQIFVRCKTCNTQSPMSRAARLPFRCTGDRPWLGGEAANEACDQPLKLLVRTASDAYFAQSMSALRLPDPEASPLRKKVQRKEVWKLLKNIEDATFLAQMIAAVDLLRETFTGYSAEEVLQALEEERGASARDKEPPLRSAEYARLAGAPLEKPGVIPERGVEFSAFRVPSDSIDLPHGIGGLVVVPELREVRVQLSFSRFDSIGADLQGEYDFSRARIRPAVLTHPAAGQKWLPAAEIRGEGIFIELDPEVLAEWESRPAVKERDALLREACLAEGNNDYLGIRFYLLHSLSHLLMTAISLECGYAASAIRERIYCSAPHDPGPGMAAILLMTGTTGSEGTLGGLVEEGRRLRLHLREAWELGRLCSNDPVCAAHDPRTEMEDRHLEGAACHGCLYIAENSCERFNRYLDRALVVPTIGNDPELAYFGTRP